MVGLPIIIALKMYFIDSFLFHSTHEYLAKKKYQTKIQKTSLLILSDNMNLESHLFTLIPN